MPRPELPRSALLLATLAVVGLCAARDGTATAATTTQQGESVTEMFGVLRHSSPTTLPAGEARTLARLRAKVPGRRVRLDAGETRRIGPRRAALYLIPGTNGVCAVHGSRGICSDNLARLSSQGVRFTVTHRYDRIKGTRPVDLYGALPDGLTTITVTPYRWPHPKLMGTNAHHNGYVFHLPGTISTMMISGPRGGASLGPLGQHG